MELPTQKPDTSQQGGIDYVPVIDLAPYLDGAPGAMQRAASELHFAQVNIGFYFVRGHGIPQTLLAAVQNELKKFFQLPMARKMQLQVDDTLCGYVPPKSTIYTTSKINTNTKRDLNETLLAQRARKPGDPKLRDKWPYAGLNKWPAEIPTFGPTMEQYFSRMEELGRKIVRLYAVALGKPPDFFDANFSEPHVYARLSHYPKVQAEENQFGISPHCDHSFMTLLPVFDVPGLQVLTQSGNWLPVPSLSEAILVNTGETLNRISNDRFIATPHRVIPPSKDRYSAAFFFNPNDEMSIAPLDTCIDAHHPSKYEDVTFLDYFHYYMSNNYLFLKDKGYHKMAALEMHMDRD